jgi:uncharacterized protein YcbX
MSSIVISSLHVYPIKSCGGLSVQQAELGARGLLYDRQWMIVQDDDEERGLFLTQRELPAMALIQPSFAGDQLIIDAPHMSSLAVPLTQRQDAATLPVIVWNDMCLAVDEGDDAAQWVSDYLGAEARLVRMHDDFVRAVDMKYTSEPAQTGFADGYPLLVISEASLQDLNMRLAERSKATIPMTRFRPNMVVRGCESYAEDDWKHFYAGDVPFDAVKTCARCPITTVDPATGTIPDSKEPLATLATYRKAARGVMFGQNIIHRAAGTLHVGDTIRLD